jgi:hypothetical protein
MKNDHAQKNGGAGKKILKEIFGQWLIFSLTAPLISVELSILPRLNGKLVGPWHIIQIADFSSFWGPQS